MMGDKTKHLVRVGHEFAAAMSDDTPIITIAKMVTELASALDVQSARSDALAAKLNDVCAESAALKKFIREKCFVVPDGASCFAEADECAEKRMPETPNTDAWVNEQRAVGADLTKQQIEAAMKSCYQDEQIGLIEAAEIAGSFAAQLRGSQV
ncbi:hypothetical protein NGJ69_01380 [Atlantibacter hermannii]|uniref:hypothetical protein n=1 Tax=Atlantibacter hermannii TaxID=565 RepID=UPI002DB71748|nr:hypothetical protein [Atlantibacter hermannii]MEB7922375.1 hypothetical protein [Atlantibacter hermannii]